MTKRRRLHQVLIFFTLFLMSLVGLIGFAHTKTGRPMLMKLARYYKGSACPLGYDKVSTLEEQKNLRFANAQKMRNMPHARFRSVMGFSLGRTKKSDLLTWTTEHSGICKTLKTDFESECTGPFFGTEQTTLWVEFDAQDLLVSVRGVEKFTDIRPALDFYQDIKKSLKKESDGIVVETGATTEKAIQEGLLAQSSIASGYDNYRAEARLTNVGNSFEITHNFISF
jgi:hypothetical protein